MSVKRLLNFTPQFFDSNGEAYVGARLFFYAAGSTTKQNTYTDSTGGTPNSNAMVCNASGYPTTSGNITEIWGTVGLTYKIGLAIPGVDDPPAAFIWTMDNVQPINDTTSAINEWIGSSLTPTYISATQFSVPGDHTTDIFEVGRSLKSTITAGTGYHKITASSFGAGITTVTVNGTSLDSGLSAISYGILSVAHPSLPILMDTDFLVSGSSDQTKKIRFEVDGLTTAKTRTLTVPNEDFTLGPLAKGHIGGFTYANNGGDSIDIAAGAAADATTAYWITGAALTKNITSAWVVGNAQGMLDTGAVGNSDYYLWVIARSDTGVVDYLGSLSSTAPTMPASYDFKRLIGWFKRVGATNVAFHTYETAGGGLDLNWDVPTLDINLANTLTTSVRADPVKVPQNLSTIAHFNSVVNDATQAASAWIHCPDQTDAAPSTTGAPLFNNGNPNAAASICAENHIRTSAIGTIAARATLATVDLYAVSTMGFSWSRR